MSSDQSGRVVPFPTVRLRNTDFLRLMHQKHIIHSLMEFDITQARRVIGEHKAATGESLSFTAFVIGCLAKAIDEDKRMHAYQKGRKHLVLFDDVDVTTLVEHEVDGAKIATPHILRAANRKDLVELHSELRQSQQQKAREFTSVPWYERLFFALPSCMRIFLLARLGNSPYLKKKVQGTVVVTAAGMFGRGLGWGIPMTTHTLCVTVGGIGEKPGIVGGRIEVREYLSLTVSADHDVIDGAPLARFTSGRGSVYAVTFVISAITFLQPAVTLDSCLRTNVTNGGLAASPRPIAARLDVTGGGSGGSSDAEPVSGA